MSNKRFLETEKAIFVAYCKLQDFVSAKKVAKCAHISRSTLYRHHKIVQNIPKDYERYLADIYAKRMKKYSHKKHISLKFIYFRTLIFIYNHRKVFLTLFKEERKDVIKEMLLNLRKEVANKWGQNYISDKLYNVYANEVVGIIETWSKNNFSRKRLDIALGDIMFLTETAPKRLSGLKL